MYACDGLDGEHADFGAGGDAQILGGRQEEAGQRRTIHSTTHWRTKVGC